MSLRAKLILPLLLFGLVLVVSLGVGLSHAWRQQSAATARGAADATVRHLIDAAAALAVERGTGTGILANPAAAPRPAQATRAAKSAEAAALLERGLAAGAATEEAPLRNAIAAARAALAPARAALADLAEGRGAGAALPAPGAWFAAVTAEIDAVAALRRHREARHFDSADLVVRLGGLRALLADLAEYAGRERGLLNGLIAAGRAPTPAEQRSLGGFDSIQVTGWNAVAAQADLLPAELRGLLQAAELRRRTATLPLRDRVLAALDAGQPAPVTPAAWFAATTQAIDEIMAASAATSSAVQGGIDEQVTQLAGLLAGAVAALLAALAVLAGTLLWQRAAVTRPLGRVVAALAEVGAGRLDKPILPRRADGRGDEVDALLAAAERFRLASIGARDSETQRLAEGIRAAEERAAALRGMADRVDTEVRRSVDEVVGRVVQLRDRAEGVAASAEVIAADGGQVARSADEALTSAGQVAAATEQLTASIGEISAQISATAAAARGANGLCAEGSAAIRALAESVGRIGGAARLIADVAARTNLLALNATIEAARAGEAGKGFAVVAQEVKQLAAQTARATEDIGRQVQEVAAATEGAIGAVGNIAGAVTRVDEAAAAIAAAVEEQAVTTREIAGIVGRSAASAREVAAAIGQVAGEARDASAGAADMRTQAAAVEGAVTALKGTLAEVVRTAAPETDRRRAARIVPPYPVLATLATASGRAGSPAEIVNVSAGGLELRSEEAVAPGATVFVSAPDLGLAGSLAVRVVDAVAREGATDLHLAFENLPPASAAALQGWLATHAKAA